MNIEEVPLRQVEANLVFPFTYTGNVGIEATQMRLYNDTAADRVIKFVRASVGAAPLGTGSGITIDILKNEITIFTSGSDPTSPYAGESPPVYIPAGQYTATATPEPGVVWKTGEYLTVSITSIGSSFTGSDLTINVVVSE